MTDEGDKVVMIQSIVTLRAVIQCQDFKSSMLIKEFPGLIQNMCNFTLKLEDSDHRAEVVELMGELVLFMGTRIAPILEPIYTYLCNLWSQADMHSPVRTSVLDSLTRIVRSSGLASDSFHPTIHPLITAVFSHEQLGFVRSEGCDLWLAVVRGADKYTPELDAMFKESIPHLFTADNQDFAKPDSELMHSVMMVMEAYATIGGEVFVESCRDCLVGVFSQTLCQEDHSVKEPKMTACFMRPVEALFFSAPLSTCKLLCDVGAVACMLRSCAAATPTFKDYFALCVEKDISIVTYLSVVCRVLLLDPAALTNQCNLVLGSAGIQNEGSDAILLQALFRLMIDIFDKVEYRTAGVWHQKLWIRTLLGFYPTMDATLISWLPEVVNAVISHLATLAEEKKNGDGSSSSASMINFDEEVNFKGGCDDDEGARPGPPRVVVTYDAFMNADPITSMDPSLMLSQVLEGMRSTIGEQQYVELVAHVTQAISRFSAN